jgi:hypothetical protein
MPKEIILYNTNLSPYISRFYFEGSVSGRRLRDYIRSIYGLPDQEIIMLRYGKLILGNDYITFDACVAWVWLPH